MDYMDSVKKNRYLDALKKLMLFSAIFHVSLIIIYSIIHLNFRYFNFFNILELDLFFPNIINGSFSQIFSIITMLIIYGIFYFVKKK